MIVGLDITAYKNIKICKNQAMFDCDGELLEEFDDMSIITPYLSTDYPQRAEDIENRKAYEYEDAFSFRAGAYSGYNRWREDLARVAGYEKGSYEEYGRTWESYAATVWNNPVDGAFMELICFSDCEGVIGTKISKKLLKDFEENEEKAKAEGGYFYDKYLEFKEAFEIASENGLVEYH